MFANKFQNRAAPVPAFQLERCATSEPAEPRYPKRKRAEVHYICEDAGDTDDESELEYGPPKVFEPLLPIYDALCLRNTTPARASHEVTARTQDISLHVSACRVAKACLLRQRCPHGTTETERESGYARSEDSTGNPWLTFLRLSIWSCA
jgi:hypothetical protein